MNEARKTVKFSSLQLHWFWNGVEQTSSGGSWNDKMVQASRPLKHHAGNNPFVSLVNTELPWGFGTTSRTFTIELVFAVVILLYNLPGQLYAGDFKLFLKGPSKKLQMKYTLQMTLKIGCFSKKILSLESKVF